MTTANKKATAPSKTETPVAQPVAIVPAGAFPFTTFHVAQKFGVTPFQLRRVLRTMDEWNDGKTTAYRWQSLDDNDPSMVRIAQRMSSVTARGTSTASAAVAAEIAKARLQEAQAQAKPIAPSKSK